MQMNVNNFLVAQMVPEIYAKNTSFKISQMYFFATHCIFIYKGLKRRKYELEKYQFVYFGETKNTILRISPRKK